jgi:uncharacterized membrane protein YdjX (TVP38/TMEM64 family)
MRRAKITAVVLAVTVVVIAQRLGIFELAGDPARVKQALVELGPWGYFAFLAAYTLLQPFGVPGTVFVIAAPLIWPWPIAFVLSMIGTLSASCVGFSFARFVARDWVSKMVPARFHAYDEALAKRAFVTVFTLRFIFWMPPLLHAFFGLSKVRFSTHFWGSAAGYFLPLLVTSYFGPKAFDALRDAPASAWIGVGAVAVVVLAAAWAIRRRGSRASRAASIPTPPPAP